MGREKFKGTIIYVCLVALISTIIGIHFLDVSVKNIEIAEQGIFKVITSEGSVSINPSNILRIERTFTKAAITGVPVELDKIYTEKGFIYFSSLNPFAEAGQAIINSVDFYGVATWSRPNTTLHTIQPYSFAIGTPKSHVSLIFVLIFIQYLSLIIGAITLFILIAPLRQRRHNYENVSTLTQETDFRTTEEQHYGVAAK
jgi:hypothetical protein